MWPAYTCMQVCPDILACKLIRGGNTKRGKWVHRLQRNSLKCHKIINCSIFPNSKTFEYYLWWCLFQHSRKPEVPCSRVSKQYVVPFHLFSQANLWHRHPAGSLQFPNPKLLIRHQWYFEHFTVQLTEIFESQLALASRRSLRCGAICVGSCKGADITATANRAIKNMRQMRAMMNRIDCSLWFLFS